MASVALGPAMPALLTKISTLPKAASVAAIAAATLGCELTSTCTKSRDAAGKLATLDSGVAMSISQMATFAPDCTMRWATAAPMPFAPPVMTATLPD